MTDIEASNLDRFKKRFPNLSDLTASAPDLVKIETARSGAKTGRLGNIRLSSAYDPASEAAKFVSVLKLSPGDHVSLYGVGLGHHLRPMLETLGADGRIVVTEANLSILKAAIESMDDSLVISDERVLFVSGSDETSLLSEWSSALSLLDPARTKVAIHIPSFQLMPKEYAKARNAVEMIRMERRFPLVMGEYENENFRRNLTLILRSKGIAKLSGVIQGGLAVVVGAGPTLDKNIHFLQGLKDAAILSSDTALPALVDNGVSPWMVFTADPQKNTRLHFDMVKKRDFPLVILPTANADVVSEFAGRLYVGFINPERFPGPAESFAKRMGLFHSGGSVSCLALETALLMGAKTVILFGQDFGFPGGRSYAARTVPGMLSAASDNEEDLVLEEDYFGCPVKTSRALYGYRRDFENMAQSGKARVLTMSPEGVRLAGIEAIPSPYPWLEDSFSLPRIGGDGQMNDENYDPAVERAFLQWLERR